jgi:hypothetical protein
MQKKIYTGLLLLAVVAIWGYVGYRFVGGVNNEDEDLLTDELLPEEMAPVKIKTNQKLVLNYPDPFLKTENKPAPIQTGSRPLQNPIKKIEKPVVPVTNFEWPTVQYKGLIQNQSNPTKLLALLVINGKEQIVKKGEKIEFLIINNIDKDKVEIVHEKEKIEYRK